METTFEIVKIDILILIRDKCLLILINWSNIKSKYVLLSEVENLFILILTGLFFIVLTNLVNSITIFNCVIFNIIVIINYLLKNNITIPEPPLPPGP